MAYNNNNQFRQGGYGQNTGYNRAPAVVPPKAQPLPANYVDLAEKVMVEIKQDEYNNPAITTSKLRSLFGLFSELYNEVTHGESDVLTSDQAHELTFARVRIVYEIGRDKNRKGDGPVGIFAKKAKLIEYLLDIGNDPTKLKEYYHYFEALVAYHRFYFGNNDKA